MARGVERDCACAFARRLHGEPGGLAALPELFLRVHQLRAQIQSRADQIVRKPAERGRGPDRSARAPGRRRTARRARHLHRAQSTADRRNRGPLSHPRGLRLSRGGPGWRAHSYGPEQLDVIRRSASYVDRILPCEPPALVPIPAPVKFELVINMKSAQALGLEVPPTLLARADEVIE